MSVLVFLVAASWALVGWVGGQMVERSSFMMDLGIVFIWSYCIQHDRLSIGMLMSSVCLSVCDDIRCR